MCSKVLTSMGLLACMSLNAQFQTHNDGAKSRGCKRRHEPGRVAFASFFCAVEFPICCYVVGFCKLPKRFSSFIVECFVDDWIVDVHCCRWARQAQCHQYPKHFRWQLFLDLSLQASAPCNIAVHCAYPSLDGNEVVQIPFQTPSNSGVWENWTAWFLTSFFFLVTAQ